MPSVEQSHHKAVSLTIQALLFMVAVCAMSCSMRPKVAKVTLQPPPVEVNVAYHAGTPLSGPVNEAVQIPDQPPLRTYELRLVLLDHFASSVGQPLSIHARLITSMGTSTAVLPATSLTRSVRWVRGEPPHLSHQSHQSQAVAREIVLMNNATVQVRLQSAQATGEQLQRQVMLAMRLVNVAPADAPDSASPAAGQQLRLALSLTDDAESYRRVVRTQRREAQQNEPNDEAVAPARSPRAPDRSTETLVVDLPLEEEHFQGSIILPFEVTGTSWRSIMITLQDTGRSVSPELVTQVNTSLTHWQQVVAARPSFASKQFASDHTELTSAFELLDSNTQRRSAMIFLAGRTGAKLLGDLALVSDELLLELLARQIKTALAAVAAPTGEKAPLLGWVLDQACMKVLVEQSGQRITRETQGVMASHLGEVARRSAIFQELVDESKTRDVFDTRLQVENLISLEDDSPSARVRAFNWLSRRAVAPQGYDPLGNAQTRRAALEKLGASTTEAAPNALSASGITDEAIPMLPSLAPMENEHLPATGSEGTR